MALGRPLPVPKLHLSALFGRELLRIDRMCVSATHQLRRLPYPTGSTFTMDQYLLIILVKDGIRCSTAAGTQKLPKKSHPTPTPQRR